MEQVIIGTIVNTHGIKGELKIKSSTDFIEERFKKGNHIMVEYNKSLLDMEITTMRIHKNHVLVSFKGLQDINLVEKYKTCLIYANKDTDLLDEGEFYVSDLVGCEIYDQGKLIGKVSDVLLYDHHDVLVVEGQKKIMIPYVDAFVESEDIDKKRIDVRLIDGFYDEN